MRSNSPLRVCSGKSGGTWNSGCTSADSSNGTCIHKYGLVASLALCVVTDFAAAFAMRAINVKAGVETLIIALFVIMGVKVASIVSGWVG